MLRVVASYISKPISRLLVRTLPLCDVWERYAMAVPLRVYGKGARRDFRWYFEGTSLVDVHSLDDIQDWLLTCDYARDPDLFQEDDYWQHPCTFEQLRKGDCEDFSLWAWRKLVCLGYDAEFVAGRSVHPGASEAGHTWIVIRHEGQPYLFDTTLRSREEMVRPLDHVGHEYIPEVSVDGQFNQYVYAGYYLKWHRKHENVRTAERPLVDR